MLHHIVIGIIVVIAIVLAVTVYGKVVMTYMQAHADEVGKAAQLKAASGWSWFLVKLQGWKTHILAGLAVISGGFASVPADSLQELIALPTQIMVADQKIAAWITTLLVALIPIFHAQGLARAAATQPQSGE